MAGTRRWRGRRRRAPAQPIRSNVAPMRQLTSLDAQFLAIENGRNLGHVSGLSIYDPSTALDRAHPLWELYVIQGLSDGRAAVFTKIHHAAIDGVSGAEILGVLLDPTPEGRELPPAPPNGGPPPAPPGQLEMLQRGLFGIPRQQLRMLNALPRTVAHLDAIPGVQDIPGAPTLAKITRRIGRLGRKPRDGGMLEVPRSKAPRTVFNGPVSAHRRVAFGTLSLTTVKDIKNATGTTVNDVVVTVCAGALRTFLSERGELPDTPLVAMIPVSVRTAQERGTFGNRVSTMAVAIPTDVADPLERLRTAHEQLRSAKERHRAVPATLMLDATRFVPPAIHARASRVTLRLSARNVAAPIFNVVISNVPGSPAPLYCAGARLLANYPVSAVTDGMGLNITVLSYEDRLDFAVVADREQVPDAWPLMDALSEALAELAACAA